MYRFVLTAGITAIAAALFPELASAGGRANVAVFAPIMESSPTLAPFQHVRFCLRYPADCRPVTGERERVDTTPQTMELLQRVNRGVNLAIVPRVKSYGSNLEDSWTIAPASGDCNDYAVSKRRQLIESGLPPSALRLATTKTSSGIGHLVLVVSTTKADLVLDSLSEKIRPWQQTDYQWLKIQSANDPHFWKAIEPPGDQALSQLGQGIRIARR